MAMNKKIVSTIALSSLTAAMLTLTGCGSSSSTANVGDVPVVKSTETAYKDWTTNVNLMNSYTLDDESNGIDITTVWKGSAGSNDPVTTAAIPGFVDFNETLTGDITVSRTLDANLVYGISGKVRVMPGVTLTIPAGTVLAGDAPTSYLLVKPGAQIVANGTQAAPVVFTSKDDLSGLSDANATGEWGGLILLGNAYTDHGVVQYEAGDVADTFGAVDHANDGESSGALHHVVIMHTGFEVEVDKELNGLSLGGVGSGTSITNVAIVGGSDDGMEIWGGTVDVTGLYVYNAKDDSVDTDLGYRGNITDVYVKQVIVDKTNNHDSAAIETGNDQNSYDVNDTTSTQPVITNFTAEVVGSGIYMKNDAGLNLTNARFTSAKTADVEMVTYRTADVIATDAMHADLISFKNTATLSTDPVDFFANANTKD